MKYDDLLEINGVKLTKKYIQSLSKDERLGLIDPIFEKLREIGILYPDDLKKNDKSWKQLLEYKPDTSSDEVFNNSSVATDICKYFCRSFFAATETKMPTMVENFQNDEILKKIIKNRLGLDWLDDDERGPGVNEAFNLSFKMIFFQGQRSMRLVNATSMFKPTIAKYMCEKYSQEGDVVGDYSCGFGGRLMGAMASGRKYVGTDPLTVPELEEMATYLKFNKDNYTLIQSGSENYRGKENSVDLYWSSPPYFNTEVYHKDTTQAYNNGEDYFYDIYWKKTLENVKYMLKPGKWFGFNILAKYDRMIQMAKNEFGEPVEVVKLRTVKSHLTKKVDDVEKFEPMYMFINNK